ncbi:unnamed protein product [Amaranthus hypochondriacus]
MASLVLLVSEFLRPLNTQVLYSYHSLAASNLQKKDIKINNNGEDLKKSGIQKVVKDQTDLIMDNHDLPHLRIDSQLVWP